MWSSCLCPRSVCILLTSIRANAKLLICTLVLPFNDAFYFNGGLFQDPVHFLRERMTLTQEFEREITGFLVGEQRGLKLFQILILNGYVMQGNYHDSLT